jgi:hypothetical protein
MGMAPAATGAPFFVLYNRTSGTQSGFFIKETPSGVRNGSNTTFTLTRTVASGSLFLTCFGTVLQPVASNPGQMEFVLSGQTLTLGLAPLSSYPFEAVYFAG